MSMTSRLTPLTHEQMSPSQQQVLEAILAGPRGNLEGPFLAWIRSPELARHAQALGACCRYRTRLPARLSELAILVTAAWWQSQAEWLIHEPIARQAGLDEAVIAALKEGRPPDFDRRDEALIYRIGRALYDTRRVALALYQEGVAEFGEPGMVELIGLFGYYALVAMTLNTFEMRPAPAQPLPFAEPSENAGCP